jgi:AcrR family transcriptional regulator
MRSRRTVKPRPVHALAAERGVASQEVVLATALRCIERSGFEALTLAAVAQELKIRAPSLYKHVANLDELRGHVAREGSRQLLQQMQGAVSVRTGSEALFALGNAFRAFAKASPGLYSATVRTPDRGDAEHFALRESMIVLVSRVVASLEVPKDEILHVVRALRAALHGFVSLETGGGLGRPLDVEESFQRMLSMFWRGLH